MQRTLELWTGDAGVSFWAAECSEACKPDSSANGSTSNQFFEEKVCRKPCVQSDGKKDAKSGRNINSIYLRPRLQLPQQQNCPLPSHQLQAELPAVKRSWDYSCIQIFFFWNQDSKQSFCTSSNNNQPCEILPRGLGRLGGLCIKNTMRRCMR